MHIIGGVVERLRRELSLLLSRRLVSQLIKVRVAVWGDRAGVFCIEKGR